MRKLFYLVLVLSLCFSACQKEESPEIAVETISYKGKNYSKTVVFGLMSITLATEPENLEYNPESETFTIIGYDMAIDPSKCIRFYELEEL